MAFMIVLSDRSATVLSCFIFSFSRASMPLTSKRLTLPRDLGRPLPATHMPTDYLQQVAHAEKIRAPFHRLRVLPDAGRRVGLRTYESEEVRVLENMCRRNVSAGEEVRTIPYSKAARLVPRTGLGRYMDEYTRGVEDGISRLSFWSVAEEKEGQAPELTVIRLMSYDATGKLAVRRCMPPLDEELADYVGFWQDVYGRAQPLAPTPPDV